jgi:hypothetical protein
MSQEQHQLPRMGCVPASFVNRLPCPHKMSLGVTSSHDASRPFGAALRRCCLVSRSRHRTVKSFHDVSRRSSHGRLHKSGIGGRNPWSERFDRIFRNEGITGSNPVSSTERPGQGVFWSPSGSPDSQFCCLALHRWPTTLRRRSTSSCARGSTWNGSNRERCASRGVECRSADVFQQASIQRGLAGEGCSEGEPGDGVSGRPRASHRESAPPAPGLSRCTPSNRGE